MDLRGGDGWAQEAPGRGGKLEAGVGVALGAPPTAAEVTTPAGLVDGKTLYVDASLIDADASRDSVIKSDPETIARIKAAYGAVERKLDETKPPSARREINQSAPPIRMLPV